MMSMGKGAIVNLARKHKMNGGSSTKSELVSIADVLGMILWWKYFMEAQGYPIENNILYQDNKSTILSTKNGRMSAGNNSKHIKNRFFLITDKVAQGVLEICQMGTKEMWADINTKPVQGQLFRIFRAELMGVAVEYDNDAERKCTHHILLPKVEAEMVPQQDGELIEKIDVVVPKKKETLQGKKSKSISTQSLPTMKWRSVLEEAKYGSGYRPQWSKGGNHYPTLYRALLKEPVTSRH